MKRSFFFSLTMFLLISSVCAQTTFTGKPIYEILTKRAGTYLGTTTVELFPAIAPLHVSNFDSLVSYQFYDSTAFHRVIPGFMIQGGDPNSRSGPISTWGYGDPSQPTVPAEFSAAKHVRGILSAARDTDINSANSQFFICVATAAWLNNQYSIYGRVTAGMDVVDTIVNSPRDANDNPFQKIEMFITYVGSNDTVPAAPLLDVPVNGGYSASVNKTLKWFAVPDGIIYNVQVSTDSTFATIFKDVMVGTNLYTVTGMTYGLTYYWRVRTNNGGHIGPWSDTWNFFISGVGIESYAQDAPKVLVSPNPGAGVFLFSHLEKGDVIEIYDMTGRCILRTISKSSTCTIDLTEKSKGLYFYSIGDEQKGRQQGKLILR